MKASSGLITTTVAIAIAAASVLNNSPTLAKKPKHSEHQQTQVTTVTQTSTLIEVASSNNCGCSTFVSGLKSAGLLETFSKTTSSYTLFVPSDAAFAALPVATRNKLFLPQNRAILQQILSYHVLNGAVDYKKIKPGKIKTYGGKLIEFKYDKKGYLEIGKAKLKKSDLKAKNGYIYIIDTVLIPPGLLI